jgi:hypothetical protein
MDHDRRIRTRHADDTPRRPGTPPASFTHATHCAAQRPPPERLAPTGTQHDAGDVVHFRQPLATPGMCRVLSTYGGKIKLSMMRGEEAAGGFSFRWDERNVVARAVERAPGADVVTVGTIPLRSGASIEIGAGDGRVYLRTILPSGEKKKSTIVSGAELDALRKVLSDLGVTP